MSREPYNSVAAANSGTRSPGTGPIRSTSARRITELPTVDRSPSRDYATRGSPSGKPSLFFCVRGRLFFGFSFVFDFHFGFFLCSSTVSFHAFSFYRAHFVFWCSIFFFAILVKKKEKKMKKKIHSKNKTKQKRTNHIIGFQLARIDLHFSTFFFLFFSHPYNFAFETIHPHPLDHQNPP